MAWQQGGVQVWVLVCREAVTCLPGVTRLLPECDCSCAHRRAMLREEVFLANHHAALLRSTGRQTEHNFQRLAEPPSLLCSGAMHCSTLHKCLLLQCLTGCAPCALQAAASAQASSGGSVPAPVAVPVVQKAAPVPVPVVQKKQDVFVPVVVAKKQDISVPVVVTTPAPTTKVPVVIITKTGEAWGCQQV